MSPLEEQKIQKLLTLLENQRVAIERMKRIGEELEIELRVRLNDDFSIKT